MLDIITVGSKFTRPACRAAAAVRLGGAAAIDRYLLLALKLSSKPAARRCCCRLTGQTDGRTFDCFKTLTAAYHALISPILTRPVPVALLSSVPSTHHSRHPSLLTLSFQA